VVFLYTVIVEYLTFVRRAFFPGFHICAPLIKQQHTMAAAFM